MTKTDPVYNELMRQRLEAYKLLPELDKKGIADAIEMLEEMRHEGRPPNQGTIEKVLGRTGVLSIAIACYRETLMGKTWR